MKEKFFRKAKKISKYSDYKNQHIGCVLVEKGKIISSGFNSTKTHPIQKIYNSERWIGDHTPHAIHAETSAISYILHHDVNWKNVEVYTYREYKNGKSAMARPCKSCMKLIKTLGIKKIHYTTSDGVASELLTGGN